MKNLISTTRIIIVLGAIASAAAGCKQTTKPAPVDTAATTTAPATTTAETTSPAQGSGTTAATNASAGDTAIGSSRAAGATAAGAGTDAAAGSMNALPAAKNNTGQTQGTTPNTSLPVSDGSR
jgi:hypothetical protein